MSIGKYLIVVGGPTASGKTALAIRLARHFGTEIISADSRQFYRQMDIGTAKPSEEELSMAPHHLIDHLELQTEYSVGAYVREALAKLETLFAKHEVVVAAGGSGLYLRALCEGLDEFPEVPDHIKGDIEALYQQQGIEALQDELKNIDPVYYQEVDLSNPHRLIRALGVCRASGKPFSSFRKKEVSARLFTPIYLQLHWPRQQLYARINQRVDQMMTHGLLSEAKSLFPMRHLNALQTVGYQEVFDYLEGKQSLEEAVELIKRNSRRYAKRQLTWMRKKGHWKLFHPEDWDLILEYIRVTRENGFSIREATSEIGDKGLSFWSNTQEIANLSIQTVGKKEFLIPQYWQPTGTSADQLVLHELSLRCQDRGAIILALPEWAAALQQHGLVVEKKLKRTPLSAGNDQTHPLENWVPLGPQS